jgi:hypothetical protein
MRNRRPTDDSLNFMRGSGNLFRDFGYPGADLRLAKALLAAQIIQAARRRKAVDPAGRGADRDCG